MSFVQAAYITLDVKRRWYTFLTCQGNVHNIDKKCIDVLWSYVFILFCHTEIIFIILLKNHPVLYIIYVQGKV